MICVLLLMLFFHLSTTSTIKNQETKLMELFLLRSPPSSITHLSSKSSSSSRAKASAITSTAQIFLGISRLSRMSCSSSTFRNHHRVIRASGLAQAAVPNTKNAKTVEVPSKDKDLAFVAGATGKVGSRAVRELLKLGFRVRAGVRSAQRAKALIEVAELMAFIAKNPNLSYCKVVEVIAQTTAPLLPMEDILAKISSQREAPGNVTTDLATPMKEESPAKLVAEEAPSTNEVQNLRPLSPYAMYDDLKPPTSPTPTPSVTPQFMEEKEIEVTQAKYDSEPPAALSPSPIEAVTLKELTKVSDKISPLSPYTAYEDLKPPSSPSPTPSSSHIGPKESTSNGGPLVKSTTGGDAAVTDNPVVSGVQETPQVRDGNSDYRSPYPVYEEFKPPTSPTPSLPKH